MKNINKYGRILGAFFLIDFIVSIAALITGVLIKQKCVIPGKFGETMINIANNPWLLKANIFGETLTSITLVILASLLFIILKKQNEKVALAGLVLYILGASLLAASRIPLYELISISKSYKMLGEPIYMQALGQTLFDSTEYILTLIGIPLCIGLFLFYLLFYKSKIIPSFLSLWGIAAVIFLFAAAVIGICEYEVPFFLYIPYMPLEPVIGLWILVKGINIGQGEL